MLHSRCRPAGYTPVLTHCVTCPHLSCLQLVGTPWEQAPVPAAAGGYYIPRTKSGTLSGYATKSGLIPELRLSFAMQYNGNFDDW